MLRYPWWVYLVPALTWPMIFVRLFMKVSFSVIPSFRKDFGSLVRWIRIGAPLHGW